jgi:DNA-directed RNA polymerase subunit RPC12/RpoP
MTEESTSTQHFPCPGCGSRVEFAPGSTVLRCPYCGYEQDVAVGDALIEEHSFDAWQAVPSKPVSQIGSYVYTCTGCGARTETNDLSDRCQFCAAPIVVDPEAVQGIVPEAVLPFGVTQPTAKAAFRDWVRSRWFAPNALKKVGSTEQMKGTYLPHWTYDAVTTTAYTGQRGEHYWVTETYTVMVDGRPQTRTRQVQHTHWYPAAGTVHRDFDDVLVPATTHLPAAQMNKLGPWTLSQAQPFRTDYLSGFRTLRYDVEPDTGLQDAKSRMRPLIENECRRDIGGDEQRVTSMNTRYDNLMFKLMLLPLWIAAYVYGGRTWQVLINANTGEVIGERPFSKVKIALAVLGGLIAATVAIVLYTLTQR